VGWLKRAKGEVIADDSGSPQGRIEGCFRPGAGPLGETCDFDLAICVQVCASPFGVGFADARRCDETGTACSRISILRRTAPGIASLGQGSSSHAAPSIAPVTVEFMGQVSFRRLFTTTPWTLCLAGKSAWRGHSEVDFGTVQSADGRVSTRPSGFTRGSGVLRFSR